MDSGDYQKTEMELRRDARVAELATAIQPFAATVKESGASISKRKSMKEREDQLLSLPTRKTARVDKEATKAINIGASNKDHMSTSEETNTSNSDSNDDGNEDNEWEDDAEEALGSKKKHARLANPTFPSDHGRRQPVPQNVPGQWQWQWVSPQSVPAPPTQPPEWAVVESGVPTYSTKGQRQSNSMERFTRRKLQKEYEKKSKARSDIGKKPSAVHVNLNGEIDAHSFGKSVWDQNMRAFAPLILDMSIIDWSEHKPHTLQKLRDTMDNEFKYLGNPLSNKGFRNAVQKFLKNERCKLKKLCVPRKDDDCPVRIDPNQWKRLKEYWSRGDQMKKSEMMTNVRKKVQNVSKRGRRGKAGEEHDVTKGWDQSPSLTDIAEGLQASGSSVVSSSLHAKVMALERRLDKFQDFQVDVLASTDRNTKAVERMQLALDQFLTKTTPDLALVANPADHVVAADPTDPLGAADPTDPIVATDPTDPIVATGEINVVDPYDFTRIEPIHPTRQEINITIDPDELVVNPSLELVQGQQDTQEIVGVEEHDSGQREVRDVEGTTDAEADVVVLNSSTIINQVLGNEGSISTRLRRGKDRELQKPTTKKEVLRMKVQPTQSRKVESPKKQKFLIGQRVSLLNPSAPRQVVASGTITAVGGGAGPQMYHGQPIPERWYRLDVAHAPGFFVDLMHPNPDGDEYKLKDVVGASTIWEEQYIVVIARVAGLIPSDCKGKVGGK